MKRKIIGIIICSILAVAIIILMICNYCGAFAQVMAYAEETDESDVPFYNPTIPRTVDITGLTGATRFRDGAAYAIANSIRAGFDDTSGIPYISWFNDNEYKFFSYQGTAIRYPIGVYNLASNSSSPTIKNWYVTVARAGYGFFNDTATENPNPAPSFPHVMRGYPIINKVYVVGTRDFFMDLNNDYWPCLVIQFEIFDIYEDKNSDMGFNFETYTYFYALTFFDNATTIESFPTSIFTPRSYPDEGYNGAYFVTNQFEYYSNAFQQIRSQSYKYYNEGYDEGYDDGYLSGQLDQADISYNAGYSDGYDKGLAQNLSSIPPLEAAKTTLQTVFDCLSIKLFGFLSIMDIVGIVVILGIVGFVVHLIRS